VPWCEECGRYLNPPSLGEGGECPSCGRVVTVPPPAAGGAEGAGDVPWHFKLLLVAILLYLGFRAWQGVVWVAHHV